MKKEITSDKDYIEAFNQGYELSKELGLKSDILKDLSAGNNRIQAMQEGMQQYEKEMTRDKDKDVILPLDLDTLDLPSKPLEKNDAKSKDMDVDMDV